MTNKAVALPTAVSLPFLLNPVISQEAVDSTPVQLTADANWSSFNGHVLGQAAGVSSGALLEMLCSPTEGTGHLS